MFWDRSKRTAESPPESEEWAEALSRVEKVVRQAAPGAALDPMVVARLAGVPVGAAIALLQVLAGQRRGRLELRVVDGQGREVASFERLSDIPPTVTDLFGNVTRVGPEQVELIFRTAP
jgi:hypothetical protein